MDQPGRRLIDEWDTRFPRWEIIYAVAWAVGLLLAWYSGTSLAGKLAITGLILAMAGWWFLLGRRLALLSDDDAPTWQCVVYLAGVTALFVPVVAIVPDCSVMLFGLCPQYYMIRPHWQALGWVAALNVANPLAVFVEQGAGPNFRVQAMIAVGVVVLSHILGSTMDRIVRDGIVREELIKELSASRAEVATLSREAGVTEERERLAGEIHDTLAQGFTSILTLVQAATAILRDDPDRAGEHLRLAADTARDNLSEARALVGALAPAALGTGTLVDALRRQADRVRDESGVDVGLATSGEVGSLPMAVEVVLLRAAQEALTNVRKHSGAATATVQLTVTGPAAVLVVSDDGVGFDPDLAPAGFGLAAMRSRAAQVGGSVTVTSGPTGTELRVEVPR